MRNLSAGHPSLSAHRYEPSVVWHAGLLKLHTLSCFAYLAIQDPGGHPRRAWSRQQTWSLEPKQCPHTVD